MPVSTMASSAVLPHAASGRSVRVHAVTVVRHAFRLGGRRNSITTGPHSRPGLSMPKNGVHRTAVATKASPEDDPKPAEKAAEEEEWEGLNEEEDWEVPGGPNDSLSSNTALGRAVRSACDELDQLGQNEADVQAEAEALLRKLGYKGDSLTRSRPGADEDSGEDAK